ncbi:hypothetical protein DL546_009922 [Coniochaeta pulveracea]|uniref:Uncharacterized protein n=1 Tax=Coniochaeta pulveracea TaxID=177199 RepID=A0A420Y3V7_9PEZI|nr:hypothetical protein DL546_009922 [Coniochaeta pulveracea]
MYTLSLGFRPGGFWQALLRGSANLSITNRFWRSNWISTCQRRDTKKYQGIPRLPQHRLERPDDMDTWTAVKLLGQIHSSHRLGPSYLGFLPHATSVICIRYCCRGSSMTPFSLL